MTEPLLGPEHLLTAAVSQPTLEPALDRAWSVSAGDLEWDCRRTLDRIADSLFLYTAYLASRATDRLSPPRNGDPATSPEQLLETVGISAAILAEVRESRSRGRAPFIRRDWPMSPAGWACL
jgi:hypothetical protein